MRAPHDLIDSAGGESESLAALFGVGGTRLTGPEPAPLFAGAARAPGVRLGRFVLHEKIGEGSTAAIWRSFHDELHIPVAIKVPKTADRRLSPEDEVRFLDEAMMLSALEHPHIVRVVDVEIVDGVPLIVFAHGGEVSLGELVEITGGLPAPRIARIAVQLADALEAAGARGFVHRDVKPANVLVARDGHARLIDFGLAAARGGRSWGAVPGLVCGSPAYMAPEQLHSPEGVDFRSDMYGLGCTLYHAAAGVPPFERPTPEETLHATLNDAPAPLPDVVLGFPKRVWEIVARLLEKRPEHRFGSWLEAREAFTRVLDSPWIAPKLVDRSTVHPSRPSTWRRMIEGWSR